MPGKHSRNKGARRERETAKKYAFALEKEVSRNLDQYQKTSGRDLSGCQPYAVQVKSNLGGTKLLRKAFNEAFNGMGKGYAYPALHLCFDRASNLVVLDEEFWMVCVEILRESLG